MNFKKYTYVDNDEEKGFFEYEDGEYIKINNEYVKISELVRKHLGRNKMKTLISEMDREANRTMEELCVARDTIVELKTFILKQKAYIEMLERDALVMSLRLLGENEDTFGPECLEVMERWSLKAIKELEKEV